MQTDLIAIRRGLLGPEIDRPFWRAKAERRVLALEVTNASCGLTAAEETELMELKTLLSQHGGSGNQEASPNVNRIKQRPGPAPKPARDGDRLQARQRVNVEVRTGRRPHANELPCADCGHAWSEGERRHEYDHHRGYAAAHHYDVEPVCTLCHAKRDSVRKHQTHCKRGHPFDQANTYIKSNGTRGCRVCMKIHEQKRGPRGSAYWKKVNERRSKKSG